MLDQKGNAKTTTWQDNHSGRRRHNTADQLRRVHNRTVHRCNSPQFGIPISRNRGRTYLVRFPLCTDDLHVLVGVIRIIVFV